MRLQAEVLPDRGDNIDLPFAGYVGEYFCHTDTYGKAFATTI